MLTTIDLLEKARSFNHLGKPEKVDALLELAIDCLTVDDFLPAQQAASAKPQINHQIAIAPAHGKRFAKGTEIRKKVRDLIATLVGQPVSLEDCAAHVESSELNLDRTIVASDRRERWRKPITDELQSLKASGCIIPSPQNSRLYLVVRRP